MKTTKKSISTSKTELEHAELLFAQLFKHSNLPSNDRSNFWHTAIAPKTSFSSSEFTGKWCIFTTKENVDAHWNLIKKAVLDKKLICAKCSTALSAESHNNGFVICVYTSDWKNTGELTASRTVLTNLGFTTPIKYKRDIETINKVYDSDSEFFLEM